MRDINQVPPTSGSFYYVTRRYCILVYHWVRYVIQNRTLKKKVNFISLTSLRYKEETSWIPDDPLSLKNLVQRWKVANLVPTFHFQQASCESTCTSFLLALEIEKQGCHSGPKPCSRPM
ncbi:hypothetical protein CROQUDRAFT_206125 [Cronartium quercuum f. sp. fusiforme G11]|uniref:Uncharacterized protein n=1 Tax=Cronartium quercuum f. sp. fusiforme G11 TaxID=708437 RepID=A0A9P6T8W1_9BASI|nr:hypothetical protein CROQUDRAFT_206125 [Cronartium quercuum f. sp. fusiforme G11]